MKKQPPKTEYTVTEAAAELGCSRSTVNRLVRQMNLGRMIARIHVLSPEDVERIRAVGVKERGNPDWIALRKVEPAAEVPKKKPKGKP